MIINNLFRRTTFIEYLSEKGHSCASGFFYTTNDNQDYLVTCKHVIEHVDSETPELNVIIRDKNDVETYEKKSIPLKRNGKEIWKTHPTDKNVDIAAIPLEFDLKNTGNKPFNALTTKVQETSLRGGDPAQVVCYPLGFKDESNFLPVIRRGMISSAYGIDFNGDSIFVLDAPLHTGASGAPVIAFRNRDALENSRSQNEYMAQKGDAELIGVNSGAYGLNEGLELNQVWYSRLLLEILNEDL